MKMAQQMDGMMRLIGVNATGGMPARAANAHRVLRRRGGEAAQSTERCYEIVDEPLYKVKNPW
jgi:hypothetical protein